MRTLKENNEIKKVKLVLEAVTIDDLKQIASVFTKIEQTIAGYNLPEIERAIEVSREQLSVIMSQDAKLGGLTKNLTNKAASLVGRSREDKVKNQVLGRLITIQTMLIKLIRELPTLLTLVIKTKQESTEIPGNSLNEKTAIELARELNTQFQEIQTRANELTGNKDIKRPNDEVPDEIADAIKTSMKTKSSNPAAEKMMGDSKTKEENSRLMNVLGRNGAQRFFDYVVNALDINKGFMAKILSALTKTGQDEGLPNPDKVAQDLLNMSVEDFKSFIQKSKPLANIQVGLPKQAAIDLSNSLKPNATRQKTQKGSGGKEQITPQDLLTIWTQDYPSLDKKIVNRMVNSLRGKYITHR